MYVYPYSYFFFIATSIAYSLGCLLFHHGDWLYLQHNGTVRSNINDRTTSIELFVLLDSDSRFNMIDLRGVVSPACI